MVLKSYLYRQIAEILNVSDGFISKWWLVFEGKEVIGLQPQLPRQQGVFEQLTTCYSKPKRQQV